MSPEPSPVEHTGTPVLPSQAPPEPADEQRLRELGYTREPARSVPGFSNFAVSFSIPSVLSGCLALYGSGLNTGGPAVITWGRPPAGLFAGGRRPVPAGHWSTGPKVQGLPEQPVAAEAELEIR